MDTGNVEPDLLFDSLVVPFDIFVSLFGLDSAIPAVGPLLAAQASLGACRLFLALVLGRVRLSRLGLIDPLSWLSGLAIPCRTQVGILLRFRLNRLRRTDLVYFTRPVIRRLLGTRLLLLRGPAIRVLATLLSRTVLLALVGRSVVSCCGILSARGRSRALPALIRPVLLVGLAAT